MEFILEKAENLANYIEAQGEKTDVYDEDECALIQSVAKNMRVLLNPAAMELFLKEFLLEFWVPDPTDPSDATYIFDRTAYMAQQEQNKMKFVAFMIGQGQMTEEQARTHEKKAVPSEVEEHLMLYWAAFCDIWTYIDDVQ